MSPAGGARLSSRIMSDRIHELLRELLNGMGAQVRTSIQRARGKMTSSELASVAMQTEADTIFRADTIAETAIHQYFATHWPVDLPVEIVMEGIDEDKPLTFPTGTVKEQTSWKCIIDPIDGTRGWMFDKRSAWFLGAVAPQRGPQTSLADIVVASMVELPTVKQGWVDQISGLRGMGIEKVDATRTNLATGESAPLEVHPLETSDFHHGFAQLVRFFPPGKAETAEIEADLWDRILGGVDDPSPAVFEDQYPSSGGQIFELLSGRDLATVDIRPLVLPRLGFGNNSLTCHPYDICTSFLLEELGGVVEDPLTGLALDRPLDTTTPVAWAGYANPVIAGRVRPILRELLDRWLEDHPEQRM